ncbi:MAG: acyltransferase [Haliea sp.]|nr:MAG: acyltransferase [Haliea sp.]
MHRNNGTLVRYLAVLLVVLQHGFMFAGRPDPVGRYGFWWIGNIGVWMFFALSGFLLLQRVRQEPLGQFVKHRLLRIFPMLITVNLMVVLAGLVLTQLPADRYFAEGGISYLYRNLLWFGQPELPGQSFRFTDGSHAQVNGSLWSVYLELRAYLLLSVLAWLGLAADRRTLNLLVLIAVLLEPAKTWLHWGDPRAYSVTLAFLFGCFFASEFPRLSLRATLAAGLAGLALLGMTQIPVWSVLMLFCLCAVTVGLAFGEVPCLRVADRLPDLTYGIFLLHWPVMLVLATLVPPEPASLILGGLFVACCIAWPLHLWVEQPVRRWGHRLGARPGSV